MQNPGVGVGCDTKNQLALTRRHFFGRSATGIASVALATLLGKQSEFQLAAKEPPSPELVPKAKRVIYLFMSGGPSQLDLFDYKPRLRQLDGTELPDSIRNGQRLTTMTAGQPSLPCMASRYRFTQHGQCGAWISELLPHTARLADELTIIRSMHTEAINHDPAITFLQTGSEQPGRPSLGSWISYGIGSENQNLPAFVVMISQGSGNKTDQPLYSRLWGSGFLPTQHQGVRFRGGPNPIPYLNDPPGIDTATRRETLDTIRQLNQLTADTYGDPEIATRIAQYELACRMQSCVPELVDLSRESVKTLEMYGIPSATDDGGFARNCLLARRLVEQGVRFVQLYHRGWDQHGKLTAHLPLQCRDVDRPTWALVNDLKQRGLLDDTLVIWGGEFGRTVYSQGQPSQTDWGRDHHGRCFTMWLAGGGVKTGITFGQTDEYGYNVIENPVHVHDLNATILHLLGIHHTQLTFKYQGRDFRLTDVHGKVIHQIVS
jgi:hypothetical protein